MSAPQQLQFELRWRRRDSRWVNHRTPFDPSRFDVAPILGDSEARAFVEAHHYSGSYPAARWRHGLYERGQLVGVAVYSHPVNDKTLTSVFPGAASDSVELGRLILLDWVGFNAESWFVRRTLGLLKQEGIRGVVSHSDPMPRVRTTDGQMVMPGHVGTVYQALGARYLGMATGRTIHLLPDATVFSARAAQKVRKLERGWRAAVAQLQAHGAPAFGLELEHDVKARLAWLAEALKVAQRVRHPGNHRYAWSLQGRTWAFCGPDQRYPKKVGAP